jgi:general secretion pathway protein M
MTAMIDWFRGRSVREQRLLLAMLAIALPLLLWLLVWRPVDAALTGAWDRHAEAVDRHGRVLAAAEALEAGARPGPTLATGEIAALAGEAAGRSGLTLASAAPQGPDRAAVSIAAGEPRAMLAWLRGLEEQGVVIDDLRMTPAPDGTVALTAVLARRSR